MRVKYFQQFNVCCNNGNQISFISSVQFCRTELSQNRKYFVTDQCKQFKRNIMIAGLLPIVQNSPQHCKDCKRDKQRQQSGSFPDSHDLQNSCSRKYCQKDRTKIPGHTENNRCCHNVHQGTDQSDQFSHNLYSTSSLHALPSLT